MKFKWTFWKILVTVLFVAVFIFFLFKIGFDGLDFLSVSESAIQLDGVEPIKHYIG